MKGHGHHHHHHHHHHHEAHGHHHDRGARGFLRYLRLLPRMWTSDVNREVVRELAPSRGECVVDLGAGMGAATVEAARSGATVVAVDPMPYMRRILQLRRGGSVIAPRSGSSTGPPSRSRSTTPASTRCGP
jgi:ubiquinone/menaquinone biosynthesis C-methylase UbiE